MTKAYLKLLQKAHTTEPRKEKTSMSKISIYYVHGYCLDFSLGDIADSRFFLSIELRRRCGWAAYVGRTYAGTRTGFVLSLGRIVIMAHTR